MFEVCDRGKFVVDVTFATPPNEIECAALFGVVVSLVVVLLCLKGGLDVLEAFESEANKLQGDVNIALGAPDLFVALCKNLQAFSFNYKKKISVNFINVNS